MNIIIKFTKIEGAYTDDNLMHGKVVSLMVSGENIDLDARPPISLIRMGKIMIGKKGKSEMLPIDIGSEIVVSTVKRNQDIQKGQTYYYVDEKQVMDII